MISIELFKTKQPKLYFAVLALSDNVIEESQLGALLTKAYKDLVYILATGPISILIETIVPTKLEILVAVVF